MKRAARWLVLGFLSVSTTAVSATLRIDHAAKKFCVEKEHSKDCAPADSENWKKLEGNQTLELPTGMVEVQVQSTNTAAYTATFTDEPIEVKDIAALKTFLGGLKPYLVEIPPTFNPEKDIDKLVSSASRPQRIVEDVKRIRAQLDDLRKKIEAVQSASLKLSHGWDRLARATPSSVDAVRADVCAAVGLAAACSELNPLSSLNSVRELFDGLSPRSVEVLEADLASARESVDALRRELHEKSRSVKDPNERQQLAIILAQFAAAQNIVDAGLKLIQDAPAILKGAQATEVLATELVRVKSKVSPKKVRVEWSEGRKITLKIVKRDASANTYPTALEPGEWVFNTTPDNLLRFQAGLSLMFAPRATFDRFENGTRTGTVDKRFLWALTLGVIPRFLDWSEGCGIAGGLDFHLNPSETERALGSGLFVSWKALKLSGGIVGIKHQYMRSIALVPADTYTAQPYVALSVVGWPPFKAQ